MDTANLTEITVHLTADDIANLHHYIEQQPAPPSRNSVIRAAIREFLEKRMDSAYKCQQEI